MKKRNERACHGCGHADYIEFFKKFPNYDLRDLVSKALALLLKRQTEFPGDPG